MDSAPIVPIKKCPICGHVLELLTRKEEPELELPEMWKCLCGYKCSKWTTQQLGEA